jgi:hypothetical protein
MSRIVQLHCPSLKRTVDNYVVSPFQSNDQVFQSIRVALKIPHVTLYTVDAKPLTKLDCKYFKALRNSHRTKVNEIQVFKKASASS